MINDLFERVGGLFEKDFLFSAWIPVLLAALWFVGTWIVVVGTEACFAWYDGLTASQQFALAFLSALATVVLAYLMTALRTTFLRLCSGQTTLGILRPLFGALEFLEERRYAKLRAPRPALWHGITAHMRERIGPVWSAERPAVPSEQKRRLERQLERLRSAASKSRVRSAAFRADVDAVIEDLRGECVRYSGESLTDVYSGLLAFVKYLEDREQNESRTAFVRLGTEFVADMRRPTRLGNIVEAYGAYPYLRYRVDMMVLWPRLQQVIDLPFATQIQDRRMLLDFALGLASLSVLGGLLSLLGGPWLWVEPRFWIPLGLGQFLLAYGFYWVAIQAALSFGDLLRASCDLFRLELLDQLYRPHPVDLATERDRWMEVSQLALYGDVTSDFFLRPRR